VIIDKGKVVFDGSLEKLREKSLDSAQLTFSMAHALEKDWQPEGLPSSGVVWKADGAELTARLGRAAPPRTEVIRAVLDRYGEDVEDIAIAEAQIETVIQQIYAAGG
jgi:ABC-2 type transport system ATP-binding protein